MLSAHSTYLPKSPSLSNLPQSLTLPWGGVLPISFPQERPKAQAAWHGGVPHPLVLLLTSVAEETWASHSASQPSPSPQEEGTSVPFRAIT